MVFDGTTEVFAVYKSRTVSHDANIVSENWSCDVHPHGVATIGHFKDPFWAEDDLWVFIV